MSVVEGVQASAHDLDALLSTAVRAADAAAGVIRAGARRLGEIEWKQKSPSDFVSEVDTDAEQAVRTVVHDHLPGAVVVGEELSPEAATDADVAFVVDPLDGTTNFLHGYPEYAVSIGVMVRGRLAAGVVLNVPAGERTTAVAGRGARMDGVPLQVSRTDQPHRALIGTGFPFKHLELLDRYQRQFAEIMRSTSGVRRAGAAALDLVDVAAGRFDGFWELVLQPWDFAAGMLIVREAGGVITDLRGEEPPLATTGIVAGNPLMHRWLMETLDRVERSA